MKQSHCHHFDFSLRILVSCLLLLSGLIIYWLYRPEIFLFQLFYIDNPNPVPIDSTFAWILNNHFADVAWCIALVLIVSLLRDYSIPPVYRQTLIALPFLSEILQFTGIIPGTFDWIDMAIYLVIVFPTICKEFETMQKMKKNIIGSISIAFFALAILASGRTEPVYVTGTFTFPDDREDQLFSKTDVLKSLNLSDNPSMVLRVANPRTKLTKEQDKRFSVLYNLIETEFAKAGFAVRDQQLFSQGLDKGEEDYSKIGAFTKTDFLIEILRYDLESKLKTSKYIDEEGEPAEAPYQVSFNGAVIEFKVVSLEKNDLVGAYTFYWTPCTDGCTERFDIKARSWRVKNAIPVDFFQESARKIVEHLGIT